MRITLLILILGFLSLVFATAQAPDILIYKNDTLYLHSNPLEPYLNNLGEKRPKFVFRYTSNWRGYIAYWAIKDSMLYLNDIRTEVEKDTVVDSNGFTKILYENVSAQKVVTGDTIPVFAKWFTGNLQIPMGEIKEYVHMGYGSTYEYYLLIEINEGKILNIEKLNSDEMYNHRLKKFDEFKKTERYDSLKNDLIKEIDDTSRIDEFLLIYMTDL